MLRYSVYVDIQCDPVRYNLIYIRTIYCGLGLYRHTNILIYIHMYIYRYTDMYVYMCLCYTKYKLSGTFKNWICLLPAV